MKTLIPLFFILASAIAAATKDANEDIPSRIAQILSENSDYAFDDRMDWQTEVLLLMREAYGNEERVREVEKTMADFLASDASYAAKKKIWMDYANIVSDQSLPALVTMLDDDTELSSLALLIIQKADLDDREALKVSLSEVSDAKKIGIIQHFGDKREEDATDLLHEFLESDSPQLARSAFVALGKIGTPESAELLLAAFKERKAPPSDEQYDAILQSAERLASNGHDKQASELYQTLSKSDAPVLFRSAAMYGLFKLSSNALEFVRSHLATDDPAIRSHVIRMVKDLPPSFSKGDELLQIQGLDSADRAQLLLILASRNDPSIRQYTLNALEAKHPEVRRAALRALPKVATAADVDTLLELAAGADKDERELIVSALSAIPGDEVDKKVARSLRSASDDESILLMELARARHTPATTDSLFELSQSEDRKVRLEAIRTLEAVASHAHISRALEFLIGADSPAQRSTWARTVYRLAMKAPDETKRSAQIIEKLNQVTDKSSFSSLILVLGELGNPADLSELQPFLEHDDVDIQVRAIEALSKWPNAEPLDDLLQKFRKANERKIRLSALDGALQLINSNRAISGPGKLEMFDALMKDTNSPAEERRVISAYGEVASIESLNILVSLMEPSTNRSAVEKAIREIMRNAYTDDKKLARAKILRARELSRSDEFRGWIDEGLRNEYFSR